MNTRLLTAMFTIAAAQAGHTFELPTKDDLQAMKKLAAQSARHIELSIGKLDATAKAANRAEIESTVIGPAKDLMNEWSKFRYVDAIMFEYSACTSLLGDLSGYAREFTTPPKYQLSSVALQKRKFIDEDLPECRALGKRFPNFSHSKP